MKANKQQTIKYYWEDLAVGTIWELGKIQVSREEVLQFAQRYDPQPFHLDDDAAARSPVFGRLAASGWHTCAMAMGQYVREFLNQSASMGSPGIEQIKWLKPVYPDDTLRLRVRITDARPMKSKPQIGLARSVWELFNQHDEQVLMLDAWGMFGRRAGADAPQ